MAKKDESPVLLQRRCELRFRVRGVGATDDSAADTFEDALIIARSLLAQGRAFIDLEMAYDGHPANAMARPHAGVGTKRLSTWEVLPGDVVYCPVGRKELGPNEYAAALKMAAGAARA